MQSLLNPCLEAFSNSKVKAIMGKCLLTPAFRKLQCEFEVFAFFYLHSDCYDTGECKFLIAKSDQTLETCVNYFQYIQQINKFCLYSVIFNV